MMIDRSRDRHAQCLQTAAPLARSIARNTPSGHRHRIGRHSMPIAPATPGAI